MSEQYTSAVATHYAAYRPPLHEIILDRMLRGTNQFASGLDVGCGTGRSSVALAAYCKSVCAIDPSQSMLEEAVSHGRVEYRKGSAEDTRLANTSIDVVTFAGSLSHAPRDATADELRRICRQRALVLVYDFEVQLHDIEQPFGIQAGRSSRRYDFAANFSEFDDFEEVTVTKEETVFDASNKAIAHVLLADSKRLAFLSARYNSVDPLEEVTAELRSIGDVIQVKADIYYSAYLLR